MIPEEFEEARFKNYIRHIDMQKKMFNSMMEYLKKFNEIRDTKRNCFGYIATYGEARLKALPIDERVEKMKLHNNYGLDKTHLQIAADRWIIQSVQTVNKDIVNAPPRGCRVVCISDVTFLL